MTLGQFLLPHLKCIIQHMVSVTENSDVYSKSWIGKDLLAMHATVAWDDIWPTNKPS